MFISIITPIYNRADLLVRVYDSLKNQNVKDFEWIIIDDGSCDSLKEKIEGFDHTDFPIHYFYKENGGKHTALNLGFEKASSPWCLVLDSDDWLLPKAIDKIITTIKNSSENASGFVFLKCFSNGQIVGDRFRGACKVNASDLINIKGDKAYVAKSEILKKFKFPIYENEKFVTESFLWNKCFNKKENFLITCNEIVYCGDYLSGGLTDNYSSLLRNSPHGTMDFIMSNLSLDNKSLPYFKQAAYHFIPVFNKSRLYFLYKNLKTSTFAFFSMVLMAMFIKIKMRRR